MTVSNLHPQILIREGVSEFTLECTRPLYILSQPYVQPH